MKITEEAKAVLPGAERPHLRALTSLRIFAALHVLLFHFGKPLLERDSARLNAAAIAGASLGTHMAALLVGFLLDVARCGQASVSLFFVLSGFILAYNYLDSDKPKQTTRGQFWLARFARVYPAFLLAWLIAAPSAINQLKSTGAPHLKWAALPVLSLVAGHAWVPSWALDWNSPSWTLCTEAFFYLSFPVLFMVPHLRRRRGKASEERGYRYGQLALWLAVAVAIPAVYVILDPDRLGMPNMVKPAGAIGNSFAWANFLCFSPLLRQPELWAGVAMGHIFLMDLRQGRRLPRWVTPVSVALVPLMFLAKPWTPIAFYADGGFAPVFALLIYCLAHGGWMAELISADVLVLLGEASYALYILHVPLAGWFRLVAKKVAPGQFHGLSGALAQTPSWGYFAAYVVVTLFVAIIVFRYFETPARYWIRKRISNLTAAGSRTIKSEEELVVSSN